MAERTGTPRVAIPGSSPEDQSRHGAGRYKYVLTDEAALEEGCRVGRYLVLRGLEGSFYGHCRVRAESRRCSHASRGCKAPCR